MRPLQNLNAFLKGLTTIWPKKKGWQQARSSITRGLAKTPRIAGAF